MTRFRGKRFRGRSNGPPDRGFLKNEFFTGGPSLLPPLFLKARVIPKKENPGLRGFDD
jgi:hypothetical protein